MIKYKGDYMGKSILIEDKSYTFSDYFELAYPTKDIVAEFGYKFQLTKLELPKQPVAEGSLNKLREAFYKKLPHISITSEAARREFFVSPLLLELLDYIDFDIDIDYPLNVSDKLKGNIDYLIRSSQSLVVVEAKNADLEKGFSQLSVELIALDKYLEDNSDFIYGTVTVGDIWRFGILERESKTVLKDIDAFLVPADLEDLCAVFMGIL